MKKFVLSSAIVLASVVFAATPNLRAQDNAGQIALEPAEFNAYQTASTQTDPAAKAQALEGFLTQYPNSPVKKNVLVDLVDAYRQSNNPDQMVSAASRLLQVDPNNLNGMFWLVFVKKNQCGKNLDASGQSTDPQTCDDAAAVAQRGLTATKPADTSDDDWKKLASSAYPLFHSAIAFDNLVSKKNYKVAIDEYTKELMLYPPDATTKPGPGLADTLQLAQAYTKPGESRDEVKAIWFYARAWNFAPPAFKAQIEPQLEYWYKRYHGTIDSEAAIKSQIDGVKAQAQATLFPPADFTVVPAPTPQELAHHAYTSGDPSKLNLEDIEFILANGSKEDATGLWALLQGKATPVPGVVIAAPASELKIIATVTAAAKPKEYIVKLTTPAACNTISVPSAAADAQAYVLANGVKADTDAISDALAAAHKLTVEPAVGSVSVAVTEDAKSNHVADFIVNLKSPASCAAAPAAGSALALQPATELDGTYDSYTVDKTSGAAQIVLKEGFIQQEEKKAAPAHHATKPAAGRR